jgi:pimeloyl-ACP methyl ester carboxylesterase
MFFLDNSHLTLVYQSAAEASWISNKCLAASAVSALRVTLTAISLTDRKSVQRYAPVAQYIEWDNIGHFTDIEAPEKLAEVALSLLSS